MYEKRSFKNKKIFKSESSLCIKYVGQNIMHITLKTMFTKLFSMQ